jgi:hypothetical protein
MFVEEAPPQILVLNKSVTAALLLLYCCFTADLLLIYCCFTAALLLLYCCFTAALLLLYCWQILVLNKMDNYNEALQVLSLLALLVQNYKY